MKHLFICSTPLQLMTAINLRISKLFDDDVTVYILNHSHSSENLYKKIKSMKIFNKVFFLRTLDFNNHWLEKYKITRYTVKAIDYLKFQKISTKIIIDNTKYDRFWVSHMDRSSWVLFLNYKKRNKNLELNFFEDGISSYKLLNRTSNKLDKKLTNILNKKTVFDEINALYVYEPKIVLNKLNPWVKIEALPKMTTFKIKMILNEIFSFDISNLKLLENKYIFFESPYELKEIKSKQFEVINYFIKKLNKEFCLKLHPRTYFKDEVDKNYITDVDCSLELLCINKNVSKNIFISILSTVGITPKLMLNQEPIVIFLYRLINMAEIYPYSKEYIVFIEDFKNTYTDKSRIFIPESMSELEEIIDKLSLKNSQETSTESNKIKLEGNKTIEEE